MQFVQSKEYVYETSSFVRFMATNDDLSTNTGAKLDLYSVSYSNQDNENGIFKLSARKKDGNYIDLIGDGNGLLTWDGKLISTGSIDLSGYVLKNSPEVSNTIIINGNNEGSAISRNNGTELHLSKWDDSDNPGGFILKCPKNKDCSEYVELVGSSGGILKWNEEKVLTEGDLNSFNLNVESLRSDISSKKGYIDYTSGIIAHGSAGALVSNPDPFTAPYDCYVVYYLKWNGGVEASPQIVIFVDDIEIAYYSYIGSKQVTTSGGLFLKKGQVLKIDAWYVSTYYKYIKMVYYPWN